MVKPELPPPPPKLNARGQPYKRDPAPYMGNKFAVGNKGNGGGAAKWSATYKSAEQLWARFEEYVQFVKETPLETEDYATTKAGFKTFTRHHVRPMLVSEFRKWAPVDKGAWTKMLQGERGEDFQRVCQQIQQDVHDNKLSGGYAGIFKTAVVVRDLHLADKREVAMQTRQEEQAAQGDIANLTHPDDPDPFREDPLLFTQRQLDAGVQYPMKVVSK